MAAEDVSVPSTDAPPRYDDNDDETATAAPPPPYNERLPVPVVTPADVERRLTAARAHLAAAETRLEKLQAQRCLDVAAGVIPLASDMTRTAEQDRQVRESVSAAKGAVENLERVAGLLSLRNQFGRLLIDGLAAAKARDAACDGIDIFQGQDNNERVWRKAPYRLSLRTCWHGGWITDVRTAATLAEVSWRWSCGGGGAAAAVETQRAHAKGQCRAGGWLTDRDIDTVLESPDASGHGRDLCLGLSDVLRERGYVVRVVKDGWNGRIHVATCDDEARREMWNAKMAASDAGRQQRNEQQQQQQRERDFERAATAQATAQRCRVCTIL